MKCDTRIANSEWRMDELLFAIRYSPFAERAALTACFVSLSFAGLVVLARSLNPIPSRTRPLNSSAPMVLWLKPWESRSLPGLPRTKNSSLHVMIKTTPLPSGGGVFLCGFLALAFAGRAIFGHDWRPACRDYRFVSLVPVHSPFISKFVRSPALKSKPYLSPEETSPCASSFVLSLPC